MRSYHNNKHSLPYENLLQPSNYKLLYIIAIMKYPFFSLFKTSVIAEPLEVISCDFTSDKT